MPIDLANKIAAEITQSIFEAWLKEHGKVVYGENSLNEGFVWSEDTHPLDTHTALLINIQEIEKKKHECQPKYLETNSDYENQMTCACGKKLRVKYEAVE